MFCVLEHVRFPAPEPGKRSGAIRPVILDTGHGAQGTMSRITGGSDTGHPDLKEPGAILAHNQ
jgi:hypothetical protein